MFYWIIGKVKRRRYVKIASLSISISIMKVTFCRVWAWGAYMPSSKDKSYHNNYFSIIQFWCLLFIYIILWNLILKSPLIKAVPVYHPSSLPCKQTMTIPMTASASAVDVDSIPRPKDVGVLAMETYFPRRVCIFVINLHLVDSYFRYSASQKQI